MVKTKLDWTTDYNGMMLGLRIHDSSILSISYTPGESAVLQSRRLDGEIVLIELNHLQDFYAELWDGAIVSDVWVWKVDAAPAPQASDIDFGWNKLYRTRCSDRNIDDAVNRRSIEDAANRKIKDFPESFLVQVSTLYGGDIVAVCKDILVFEIKNAGI